MLSSPSVSIIPGALIYLRLAPTFLTLPIIGSILGTVLTPFHPSHPLLQPIPLVMCNLETEGTKFGCGHYKITKQLRKIDCGNRYCKHSVRHPQICPNCSCEPYLGPDKSETVTAVTKEYCSHCNYWYRGEGRR